MFNHSQYAELSRRFNSKTFAEKVKIIKENSNIFYLESKSDWITLRLVDEEAQERGDDLLFNWDNNKEDVDVVVLFQLLGVLVK